MMLQRFFVLLMILSLFFAADAAAEGIYLRRVAKMETPTETSIRMELSGLPQNEVQVTGQRIDILLEGTAVDAAMPPVPEGGTVLKAMIGRRGAKLVLSLTFSRAFGKVNLLQEQSPPALVLEVSLDKTDAKPVIIEKPARQVLVEGQVLPRGRKSEYAGRWKDFFREYETSLVLGIPLKYSFPVLPQVLYTPERKDEIGSRLKAGIDFGNRGHWKESIEALKDINPGMLEGIDHEALLILLAEGNARVGAYNRATPAVEEFIKKHPDSALIGRAGFLFLYLKAVTGGSYAAQIAFPNIMEKIAGVPFYRAYASLLRSEAALANERLSDARTWLKDEGLFKDGHLETERALRLADIHMEQKQYRDAVMSYRQLPSDDDFWAAHPDSCGRFAEALFRIGDHTESARMYGILFRAIPDGGSKWMSRYGQARAEIKSGATASALQILKAIRHLDEKSEYHFRAWMEQLDFSVVNGLRPGKGEPPLAVQYGAIAAGAPSKPIREEAAFKKILLDFFDHRDVEAFSGLRLFRKNFLLGDLAAESEAVAQEFLPEALERLLDQGQNLEALVIVEQNRDAVTSGRISAGLILRLGESLYKLGLLERAEKVCRYILESGSGGNELETIAPLLLKVLEGLGRDSELLALSDEYSKRFPKGNQRVEFKLARARAFERQSMEDKALEELYQGDGSGKEGLVLAASIFWKQEKYEEVARALQSAMDKGAGGVALELQLAEALFKSGRPKEALALYEKLLESQNAKEQARFRIAQIHREAGNQQEALKHLRILVDETGDSLWKKMATESLAVMEVSKY